MSLDSCDKCKRTLPSRSSAVLDGVYYKRICADCLAGRIQTNSGDARWQRTIDVEDNAHELLQPYGADGKPSADFIKAYPAQAQSVMTEDELRSATRN